MMLAGPPAAAITYVKESSGLDPSEYGGGGSHSSAPLFDDSPLVSVGSAAFVSVSVLDVTDPVSSRGVVGENAGGGCDGSAMQAFNRSGGEAGRKYREEKGGGAAEREVEEDGESNW